MDKIVNKSFPFRRGVCVEQSILRWFDARQGFLYGIRFCRIQNRHPNSTIRFRGRLWVAHKHLFIKRSACHGPIFLNNASDETDFSTYGRGHIAGSLPSTFLRINTFSRNVVTFTRISTPLKQRTSVRS